MSDSTSAIDTSPEAMVRKIDRAIYYIVTGGQSYSIGSRSFTKSNLGELRDMREYYRELAHGGTMYINYGSFKRR